MSQLEARASSLDDQPPQAGVPLTVDSNIRPEALGADGVLVVVAGPFLKVKRLDPVSHPAVSLGRSSDERSRGRGFGAELACAIVAAVGIENECHINRLAGHKPLAPSPAD